MAGCPGHASAGRRALPRSLLRMGRGQVAVDSALPLEQGQGMACRVETTRNKTGLLIPVPVGLTALIRLYIFYTTATPAQRLGQARQCCFVVQRGRRAQGVKSIDSNTDRREIHLPLVSHRQGKSEP
jgi:hypothetical protein